MRRSGGCREGRGCLPLVNRRARKVGSLIQSPAQPFQTCRASHCPSATLQSERAASLVAHCQATLLDAEHFSFSTGQARAYSLTGNWYARACICLTSAYLLKAMPQKDLTPEEWQVRLDRWNIVFERPINPENGQASTKMSSVSSVTSVGSGCKTMSKVTPSICCPSETNKHAWHSSSTRHRTA